ncbi:MAG: hypothetical protein ABW022_23860 [Actinoplanes sp.]
MARFGSGDTTGALDLMRRHWGIQVDPNSGYYTGTFWEFVNANGLPSRGFDSLAHAWAAGPTQLLTESILGATAVNPGYGTWQVKPRAGTLTWAQGQVPTTNGSLHAGTSGQVWVPLASTSATSTPVSSGATLLRRDGLYDVYAVGAGVSEFTSAP